VVMGADIVLLDTVPILSFAALLSDLCEPALLRNFRVLRTDLA